MDAFGRGIAIVLAAIAVFLIPIKYVAMNQEEALNTHAHSETVKFAEEIMLQGYLTTELYNKFMNEINAVNQLYEVEIIHGKSTEGLATHLDCVYMTTIREELAKNGVYHFVAGDIITIKVTPNSTSYLQKLIYMFTLNRDKIRTYSYGGKIHG